MEIKKTLPGRAAPENGGRDYKNNKGRNGKNAPKVPGFYPDVRIFQIRRGAPCTSVYFPAERAKSARPIPPKPPFSAFGGFLKKI
jgi:hypothetical protein